jgi:hypothetical protein
MGKIIIRVSSSCDHCFKIMLPFLAETANIEPVILIDKDPRAAGLPGGKTPVVIGVFDDGTSMYFDRFTDNPVILIEAF